MNYRNFGNTDLEVSEVGFGTWGIGGPAMAGDIPLGWGKVDDDTSLKALQRGYELGVRKGKRVSDWLHRNSNITGN